MEAVNKLAQTTMALSCVLVVQAILWLMMILAVMVNCVHIFANNVDLLDVDECSEDTHVCAQTCTNNNGSFLCSCDTGFILAVND